MKRRFNVGTKPNVFLFYICYTVIIVSSMLREVLVLEDITSVAYQIALVILTFSALVALSRLPRKMVFLLIILFFVAIAVKISSGTNTMIVLVLLVTAFRGIKLEDIIKYDLALKIPLMFIVPMLYFMDLTNVNVHYRDDGTIRHSMGFSNPNLFGALILSIIMEVIYLRRNKLTIFDAIFVLLLLGIINYFTDSQTSILCGVGLLVVVLLMQLKKRKGKKRTKDRRLLNFLARNIFTILFVFSIVISAIYSNSSVGSPIYQVDRALNGRIGNASNFLEDYSVEPFGQKIELVSSMQAKKTGEKTVALDNLYIYSLLCYGAVTVLILCVLINRYINSAKKNNLDILVYIMVILLIGGLSERFCLDIQYNVFLLYFAYMLYGSPKKMLSEKQELDVEKRDV